MKHFLNKFIYLHLRMDGNNLYFTCAYVTEITDTHISFEDDRGQFFTHRRENIIEVKLSNRNFKPTYEVEDGY
jgi:hypothetical protein